MKGGKPEGRARFTVRVQTKDGLVHKGQVECDAPLSHIDIPTMMSLREEVYLAILRELKLGVRDVKHVRMLGYTGPTPYTRTA